MTTMTRKPNARERASVAHAASMFFAGALCATDRPVPCLATNEGGGGDDDFGPGGSPVPSDPQPSADDRDDLRAAEAPRADDGCEEATQINGVDLYYEAMGCIAEGSVTTSGEGHRIAVLEASGGAAGRLAYVTQLARPSCKLAAEALREGILAVVHATDDPEVTRIFRAALSASDALEGGAERIDPTEYPGAAMLVEISQDLLTCEPGIVRPWQHMFDAALVVADYTSEIDTFARAAIDTFARDRILRGAEVE